MKIDPAGRAVLDFMGAAQNLTKVGELTAKVTTIADSSSWRRYTTAIGTDEWRECEFDYFLIACGLAWDDVSKIIAWSKVGAEIAPLMDHDAPSRKRRPLEEAGKAWHAAGSETLAQRAVRLGWTKGEGEALRAAPLPQRARARHTYGVTRDEHDRESRAAKLSKGRRRQLDALVKEVRSQLVDDLERLYLVDQLRRNGGQGRPRVAQDELERWRQEAERHSWNSGKLAEVWGVTIQQARRRLHRLR